VKIEESLPLATSPEELWPWISTPERLAEWIADVERFEVRPEGELAVGSRLIAYLPRGGSPLEARVEAVERGRSLSLRTSGLPKGLEVLLSFQVREQAGGSVLTLRAETELKGMMVFAEKIIASKARAQLAVWTKTLRARTEAKP
jgi:uncharacterized protein YndB with AHSA1/START domain